MKDGAIKAVEESLKKYWAGSLSYQIKDAVRSAFEEPAVRKISRQYIAEEIMDRARNYEDND